MSKLQQSQRDKLFSIPDSEFYPGYFSRVTVNFLNLLETEQVKEAIADAPDKYRSIIEKYNRERNPQKTGSKRQET